MGAAAPLRERQPAEREREEGTDAKTKHRNETRDRIASSTEEEVEHEMEKLREKLDNGTLTKAEVDELVARKDKELELEYKYGVNLTNDTYNKGGDSILDQQETSAYRA